jgi:hypothetical protein
MVELTNWKSVTECFSAMTADGELKLQSRPVELLGREICAVSPAILRGCCVYYKNDEAVARKAKAEHCTMGFADPASRSDCGLRRGEV